MKTNADPSRRAFWLKHLHTWHWISSAVCLIGMLLFAATGLTLNHAAQIESQPRVTTREGQLPGALREALAAPPASSSAPSPTPSGATAKTRAVPDVLSEWLSAQLSIDTRGRDGDWSDGEIYISLPRPGGDAWVSVDLETGDVRYERTDRGWIAYLNDLHKGRHTGEAWRWFIDVFAVACFVFCVTGLFLLQLHGKQRPSTWPLVGLGLVVPLLLAILFMH